MSEGIFPLKGAVQHYAWGGETFIPDLLSMKNPDSKPFAEYWIGTHHRGAAQVLKNDEWINLDQISSIPFLMKVLDVQQMLSIQSHPSKEQAELGFNIENQKEIPLDAFNRVFKDDNHKPELMVALSDFWLLHGFQSLERITNICHDIPAFNSLLPAINTLPSFFSYVMNLDSEETSTILNKLSAYLETVDTTNKDEPHFWAAKALEQYGHDKGIFSIYFFNLVRLKKGEAIYQEAGIPHAYLKGQNVEIMANSDNVFRAGLTPKHIDIDLLLSHLDFSPVVPKIIQSTKKGNKLHIFKSPAKEFEVHYVQLNANESIDVQSKSPECYFCMEGVVTISSDMRKFTCNKGESFFAEDGTSFTITSVDDCSLFRAIVP